MRSKIKIENKSHKISDREIESKMDFGAVLEQYRTEKIDKQVTRKLTIRFSAALIVVLSLIIGYLVVQNADNNQELETNKESFVIEDNPSDINKMAIDSSNFVEETDSSADSLNSAFRSKELSSKDKTTPGIDKNDNTESLNKEFFSQSNEVKVIKEQKLPIKSKPKNKEEIKGEIDTEHYVNAKPLNGVKHMYSYFEENLKYPEIALKDSIEGVVEVQFAIMPDSSITEIKVINSLGEAFDKEAIRLINEMPVWIPATSGGEPVRSEISIPFNFNIEQ
ncbi:energy transducer TonB [Mangrovivirga cuniculi]|uniref:TonB C-terminal domain-containing protein n=1 Tax=Mangrovivirga cuniculi TaxID=2715131 RepID=A0A4D7JST4_9BACT|nr:energy transducer TonB [Mangrovivirga cuniculi]QCK15752.1 hypothetical protein DCC35_13870 [Mangrovivirga cuniculi]